MDPLSLGIMDAVHHLILSMSDQSFTRTERALYMQGIFFFDDRLNLYSSFKLHQQNPFSSFLSLSPPLLPPRFPHLRTASCPSLPFFFPRTAARQD